MALLIAILIEPLYAPYQYNTETFSNVSYENSPWDVKWARLVFFQQTLKFYK